MASFASSATTGGARKCVLKGFWLYKIAKYVKIHHLGLKIHPTSTVKKDGPSDNEEETSS